MAVTYKNVPRIKISAKQNVKNSFIRCCLCGYAKMKYISGIITEPLKYYLFY